MVLGLVDISLDLLHKYDGSSIHSIDEGDWIVSFNPVGVTFL